MKINFFSKIVKPAPLVTDTSLPLLQSGQLVKVMTWNVQFMAGNKNNNFFLGGGNDPWPKLTTLQKTLHAVAAIIRQENPDILLLQEIQQHSKISCYQNQLGELLKLLPDMYPAYAYAHYLKNFFNPHPKILGSVDMWLCTLSKYFISDSMRHNLPSRMPVNFISQWFQFKRAILETILPVQGARPLHILNTHFSAFAQGTNIVDLQALYAQRLLTEISQNNHLGLLAGDFNSLASPKLFNQVYPIEKKFFSPDKTPIQPLIDFFAMVPTLAELTEVQNLKWRTHMSPAAIEKQRDKTLDFIFLNPQLELIEHYVRSEGVLELSDHLPLIAVVKLL